MHRVHSIYSQAKLSTNQNRASVITLYLFLWLFRSRGGMLFVFLPQDDSRWGKPNGGFIKLCSSLEIFYPITALFFHAPYCLLNVPVPPKNTHTVLSETRRRRVSVSEKWHRLITHCKHWCSYKSPYTLVEPIPQTTNSHTEEAHRLLGKFSSNSVLLIPLIWWEKRASDYLYRPGFLCFSRAWEIFVVVYLCVCVFVCVCVCVCVCVRVCALV